MSRIHPSDTVMYDKLTIKKRMKNIGKWLIAFTGLPFAYVCMPVSCCIRNPAAHVIYEEPNGDTPLDRTMENLVVGCFAASTLTMCGGCCCGACGKISPSEI